MVAAASPAVEGKTGNGYTFDTFKGETQENFIVAKIVAWIFLRLFGIVADADGFCSTAREWHILWKGIWAGLKAKQFGDIPECPPLWQDESQYYEGGATFSNVAKIYLFAGSAGATGGVIGIIGSLQAMGYNVATIENLRLVLSIIGVQI